MTYLVTGATGFIGRRVVDRLLARDGLVRVLVRPGSRRRFEALWGGDPRVLPLVGDLELPGLGLSDDDLNALDGRIDHLFHLGAVYDITAAEERNAAVNVGGTRHVVELAEALGDVTLHHVSSVAVAGLSRGVFREDDFDLGQTLPTPYHRTKFEAEALVRAAAVPWRVYRPSIVVGDSRTGEMDKVDGPYLFFRAIRQARSALPQWLPLLGPDLGVTNIVPVDYVAGAIDHIAHAPGLDGRAFHLASAHPQRTTDVLDAFARAAHAPRPSVRVDRRVQGLLPTRLLGALTRLPLARDVRRGVLDELGIPEEVLPHLGFTCAFSTSGAEAALAGTGIAVPELESYAGVLWDHWERRLEPPPAGDASLRDAVEGRTVVITGASSGIGQATALKVAAAGAIVLLVARSVDGLEETRARIVAAGGRAFAFPADLSDDGAIDDLVARLLAAHPSIDVLVNNAGRSIRRSIELSGDRPHDFERTMRLNYFGAIRLTMGLLPRMRERGRGHIVNVSSIGVQTNPPRFSAYVASKAALDAWTRVVSGETVGDGVTFTTIHMPLVRTPMSAPTKIYDVFPALTPSKAADLVCDAIRARPKHIGTRLGTAAEIAYAVAPRAVDQVLHAAYRVFPDSAVARGEGLPPASSPEAQASMEQRAMASLLRGVHW